MKPNHRLYSHSIDLLFLAILILSVFIRYNQLDYFPATNSEKAIYQLLGYHIKTYYEFPLVGPMATFAQWIRVPPLYYYFNAGIQLINDSVLFTGMVNSLLQISVLGITYLWTKKIFSPATAILSTVLIAFGATHLEWSISMYDPFIAPVFFYWSLYTLSVSIEKKSVWLRILSGLLFTISVGIYMAVISLLPLFLFLLFNNPNIWKRYQTGIIATTIAVFAGLCLHPHLYFSIVKTLSIVFMTNLTKFWELETITAIITPLSVLFYFYHMQKNGMYNKRQFAYLVLAIILSPILVVTLLWGRSVHYVQTSLPAMMILIAESIVYLYHQKNAYKILACVSALLMLLVTVKHLGNPFFRSEKRILHAMKSITTDLTHELDRIKKTEGYEDYRFFTMKVFSPYPSANESLDETIFWAYLEPALQTKFITIDDTQLYNFRLNTTNRYTVFICNLLPSSQEPYQSLYNGFGEKTTSYASWCDQTIHSFYPTADIRPLRAEYPFFLYAPIRN